MTAITVFLVRTPVIIGSFILMVLVGLSFMPVQAAIDGPMLDLLMTADEAQVRLTELDSNQRYIHFLGTIINDTLYPLAYGAFLAGLAGRFSGARWRRWAMLPALLTGMADLAENIVQALALYGNDDLLFLKTALSPLKFGLFFLSGGLALGLSAFALGRWLVRKMRKA